MNDVAMHSGRPRTQIFSLTIDGETRDVEVRDVWGDGKRFESCQAVGAYRKRPGAKVWAKRVSFWLQGDGFYHANRSTTILNRSGYPLIGWADKIDPASRGASKHNSAVRKTGLLGGNGRSGQGHAGTYKEGDEWDGMTA